MPPVSALEVRGLGKHYNKVRALNGADLAAAAGRVHALLGENGAGKSTLIRCLNGAVRADSGTISLGGQPLANRSMREASAAGVRTAFQELSLVPDLTVAQNVFLGTEPRRLGSIKRRVMERATRELWERVEAPPVGPSELVRELSLADRQVVEVVKALREPAKVLILDEATSALPDAGTSWVLARARAAAAAGAAVLFISHRMPEITAVADDVTVLRGGERTLCGELAEFSEDELIAAMLGRQLDRLYPERDSQPGEAVLALQGLEAGDRVGPIDLEVRAGEVLGVGGLEGQGQRELLMAVAGATRWSGKATLAGRPYKARTPRAAIDAGIALVPEDRQREGLLLDLSIRDNISLSSLGALRRWFGALEERRERELIEQQVGQLRLPGGRLSRPAKTLSGGNQQKVVLSKALLTNPKLLVLYDCTRGVDVGTKAEIFALLNKLSAEGVAILWHSSDASELVNMCDRVAVMAGGRIGAVLDRQSVSEEKILSAAFSAGTVGAS